MDLTVLVFLSSGLFLGWSLGSNDAANIFGTAVGSRMVMFSTAAVICAVFVVLGAVFGGAGAAHGLGKLGAVNAIAGSFMVAKGNLWHRGGANRSKSSRLIITPQYCAGWARPLENVMAAVPREMAAELPERVRELIGYSIHPPFMGYVDGVHPGKLLG